MRTIVLVALAAGALAAGGGAGRALAAPLSEKEVAQLARECEKAAAQGKYEEAIARVGAIAREDTAVAARALIDLGTRVEGGPVYRELVWSLGRMAAGEALAAILEEGRTTPSRERRIVIADAIASEPAGKESLIAPFMLSGDDALARLMIQVSGERLLSAGVEPLIALLEREESAAPAARRPEVAREARRALARIAGRDFETARDWRNWWEPRKATFDPFDPSTSGEAGAGAGAGGPATALREEPEFFGTEVTSSRVVIVIDISGSMAQTVWTPGAYDPSCRGHNFEKKDGCPACNWVQKPADKPEAAPAHNHPTPPCTCKGSTVKRIDREREEVANLIEGLSEATWFNVIAFNSQVQRWQRALVRATREAKASACAWVKRLREGGFTETGRALEAAFEDPSVDTIYLVSDGAPERSAKEKIPTEPILRWVEKKNRFRKVRIFTLGWGSIDEDFMRRLAEENGGTFSRISESERK